jgi:hypothetical protein
MDDMAWKIAVAVCVIGAVLYALHRLALWAEARGWIYYRAEDRPRGAGLNFLAAIYQPEMEHVIEETTSFRARGDQAETGQAGGDDDEA